MFGVKRIVLDRQKYNLDEDGWVDLRTRISVRAALAGLKVTQKDGQEDIEATLATFITGWHIKAEGEELPYSPENVLEIPFEILEAIGGEIETHPLLSSGSRNASGSSQSVPERAAS